jgi:predicted nucleotidyltransferase
MNTIYEAIVGSRLKGNHSPESDTDTMGIFIATNEEIGGFDWNDGKNVVTNASPDGDDYTFYEVRKFFRLAAKSTPAILPMLGSHKVIGATFAGQQALRIAKEDLVSEKWLRKNGNYVRGKWQSYLSTGKTKDLIEAYYIGELSMRWLYFGCLESATLEHETLFSQITYERFMSLEKINQEVIVMRLADRIEMIESHPLLQEEPDMEAASKFLTFVRNNIG